MANLTVTIAESATGLQGSESTSDSTAITIEDIFSFYQYKGQAAGSGPGHPIYQSILSYNVGVGGDYRKLAYLRVTNLEASTDTMALRIGILNGGSDIYLNLATNESFIFCPKIGSLQIEETSDGTDVSPSGWIQEIYFENSSFDGKHFEIYAAFIE